MEAKNFIPISQFRKQKDESRWFTAETDGDTGERVWEPVRIDGSDEQTFGLRGKEFGSWEEIRNGRMWIIYLWKKRRLPNYKRIFIQVRVFAFFLHHNSSTSYFFLF